MKCAGEGCTNTTRSKSKLGWFYARDNVTAYCPDHQPKWVAQWRLNRGNRFIDKK